MSSDRLRRLLLAVFVLGNLGTATELVLLGHFETWQQWLPIGLLAFGLAAGAAVAARPRRATVLGLRATGGAFVGAAVLGMYFHLRANVEFERELDASIGTVDLVWESLTGALPALAPGAMALLGLIGLVIAAGHPALET